MATQSQPFVRLGLPAMALVLALVMPTSIDLGASAPVSASVNPVVVENQKPGSDGWGLGLNGYRVADDLGKQVKGYASAASVNVGESIDLKVTVNPPQSYTANVFRLGYYGGKGARLVRSVDGLAGIQQPACTPEAGTGLIECQWSTSLRLDVEPDWTSGVYLVLLTNAAGFQSYVQFVVRDDARHADLLFKQSVMTYQAYNNFPSDGQAGCKGVPATGKNLYDTQSSPTKTVTGTPRAVKVSFDRPYPCTGGGSLLDPDWSWEGYFLTWLEMNGYDVAYTTDVDAHLRPQTLLDHEGLLSVGHDEYWTKEMFDAFEGARDQGVNIGFFGANDVYWQSRLEPSSSGVPGRTMVVYKNTPNNSYSTVDPVVQPALRTVRFQDPPLNRPAQTLIGTSFLGSTDRSTLNTALSPSASGGWPWSDAGVSPGTVFSGIIGYEADGYSCHYAPPENTGFALVAASPFRGSDKISGTAHAAAYVAPSGSLVFSAGTMSWVWGLVDKADPRDPTRQASLYDPALDRATVVVVDALAGMTPSPSLPEFTPDCTADVDMGFEGAGVIGADGAMRSFGTVLLDADSPIVGAKSARTNGASSYLDHPITAVDSVTVDFLLRLNAVPAYPVRVVVVSSQITDIGNVVLNPTTGGVTARLRNGSPPIGAASQLVQVGQTYHVRLVQSRGAGADGVLAAWLAPEGSELGAPFAQTTTATFTGRADKVRIGSTTNSQTTPPGLDADIDAVRIIGGPAPASMTLPPSSPTGLVLSLSGTSVQLRWTDTATNEAAYVVERSGDGGTTWTQIATLPPDAAGHLDASVAASTDYLYRVVAMNANGSSAPTPAQAISTPATPPMAPAGLTATAASQTQTLLAWNDLSTNETGFELQRAPTSDFAGAVTWALPANTTTYSDTRDEGVAWYRVRSVGASASTWTSSVVGARQADMTFEAGALTGTQGATSAIGPVALEMSAPLVGTASARFRAATTTAYLEQKLAAVAPETFTSLTYRVNALASGDTRIVQSLNGTGGSAPTTGSLWLKGDGTLLLRNYNTTIGTGVKLLPGMTYRLGLHQRRVSDGAIALEAFVAGAGQPFGTPFASTSSAPVSTTTNVTAVRLGVMASTNTLDATVDEAHIDTSFMPTR
ncbi:N,N-dimethylformamidase beta subunit family domain-containing protein [Humibacillus xanthopallidus]|uniref:N,N-dimethylformamidase beta subunit family domain-containing protein n=1 Tax=Humibacillus xanthopallidus TaxID=412689 RepID=UPI003850CB06